MADLPDYQELAVRYLDLWQEEMTERMAHPVWAAHVKNMLEFWAQAGTTGEQVGPSTDRTVGPAGAAAAGSAPADRDQRLDELAKRVSVLEERLRALEPNRPGADPAPRPRAPRRARPKKSSGTA